MLGSVAIGLKKDEIPCNNESHDYPILKCVCEREDERTTVSESMCVKL